MGYSYGKSVQDWYSNVGKNNPLRKLAESDKQVLAAWLCLYAADAPHPTARRLERIAKLAGAASALGMRIQREVFAESLGEALAPFVREHTDLPARLEAFGRLKEFLAQTTGKQGHKAKTERNTYLLMASELVFLRFDNYYDEHLADLLQAIIRWGPDDFRDVSGDAIRKKREHLKKAYPRRYRWLRGKVSSWLGAVAI